MILDADFLDVYLFFLVGNVKRNIWAMAHSKIKLININDNNWKLNINNEFKMAQMV